MTRKRKREERNDARKNADQCQIRLVSKSATGQTDKFMADQNVKEYLQNLGSPPNVYYGGLPRLVFRWQQFCENIGAGKVPAFDGFRSLIEMRTQIHHSFSKALPASVQHFRDVVFAADELLLSYATCFEEVVSKSETCGKREDFWWRHCMPDNIPQNELSDWPKLSNPKSRYAVKYEVIENPMVPSQSKVPQAIAEKARFLVENGELIDHCVGEFKLSGLDADFNNDWKIDTDDERSILVDIVADVMWTADAEDQHQAADGRECYFYQRKKRMLIMVFDPVKGGTAFVPAFGRESFENWNGC